MVGRAGTLWVWSKLHFGSICREEGHLGWIGEEKILTAAEMSLLVPTYEMNGSGMKMLRRALSSVARQELDPSFSLEVVVSDHSLGDAIESLCADFAKGAWFTLTYQRNNVGRGSSSQNLNCAFNHSTGRIIKILFQDDFFVSDLALATVVSSFDDPGVSWAVVGFTHSEDGVSFYGDRVPKYHKKIHHGKNTISSPSVLAVRRYCWIDFDQRLKWLMDVDLYKKLSEKHGPPKVISKTLVANGIGAHQVSRTLISPARKMGEYVYVRFQHWRRKHAPKPSGHACRVSP